MRITILLFSVATLLLTTSLVSASPEIQRSIMDKLLETSSPDLFKAYHLVFKKEYSLTSPEGALRKQIFEKNLEIIKETNAKNLSYKLGINMFSDLSKEEFKAKFLTYKKQDSESFFENNLNFLQSNDSYESNISDVSTARNIDWTKNFRAAVQQGGCGSCWAFATAGAIEGNYDILDSKDEKNKVAFSPQYLVDCDTNWNAGCNGGDPGTAFNYIINNGIPYEFSYPYVGSDRKCNSEAVKNKVVTRIDRCYNCTRDQVIGLLSRGPVSSVIDGSEIQMYRSGIFSGACYEVNHAVITVGVSIDADGQGSYKVRNSWGTGYGENGYIRVQIGSSKQSCFLEAESLLPVVKKSDAPVPDPPAPKCAKVYTECSFEGTGYEICGNTPVVPTKITASFEIGKFKRAKLFLGTNCSSGFATVSSNIGCLDGSCFQNSLQSIMVGEDPTPPTGCVWLYEDSCLSGKYLEVCKSIKDIGTLGWKDRVGSVAVGPGIRYGLSTAYGWYTTRNSHSYGLSSTFFKKVLGVDILP